MNNNSEGNISDQLREAIRKLFYSPFRDEGNSLGRVIKAAINKADQLKPAAGIGPAFIGDNPAINIDFENVKEISLPQPTGSLDTIIDQVVEMLSGMPNWGHPLMLCNVTPQSNNAAIIAALLSQLYSPNTLEGEYAWNTARAELESAGMLANLAGWEPKKAGGVYTYGGSGCWMYHLKYALARVLPGSRSTGIRTDVKVICSQQAHYTMLNSTDWTGLGTDNVIIAKSCVDSNEMDVAHLEEILSDCSSKKIPVASVVCTMATTDAYAFDPVKAVRELLNKYPNPAGYGKALLYCDAVIGWSWLTFKDYNFKANPFGFSPAALTAIEKNYNSVKDIFYADAFAVDFHKYFSPISSSIFIYKNCEEFESLLKRKEAAYLQARTPYNPHDYTLEVSRGAGGSMGGWATLKMFGQQGFQSVLGTILENRVFLLQHLKKYPDIVCVNEQDSGLATLLRIYEKDIPAAGQYLAELTDINYRAVLLENNQMMYDIGELLWKWFRGNKQINGQSTAYLSVTSGFRSTTYNVPVRDDEAVIYAIKIYPVNVFTTTATMEHAVNCIIAARDEVCRRVSNAF